MKKLISLSALVLLIGLVSFKNEDDKKGYIKWQASSKMYKANGSFENWEVKNLKFNPDSLENTTLDIVVNTESVNEKNDKLVHHLQAEDYFNVALFPEATVNVSKVVKTDTAYAAQFITTIKSISDTTTAYFKFTNTNPLAVEGYTFVNRPKHLLGIPLKKSAGITELVRVDFLLNLMVED